MEPMRLFMVVTKESTRQRYSQPFKQAGDVGVPQVIVRSACLPESLSRKCGRSPRPAGHRRGVTLQDSYSQAANHLNLAPRKAISWSGIYEKHDPNLVQLRLLLQRIFWQTESLTRSM